MIVRMTQYIWKFNFELKERKKKENFFMKIIGWSKPIKMRRKCSTTLSRRTRERNWDWGVSKKAFKKRGREKVRKMGALGRNEVAVGHRLDARDCQCCSSSDVTTAVLLFLYRCILYTFSNNSLSSSFCFFINILQFSSRIRFLKLSTYQSLD